MPSLLSRTSAVVTLASLFKESPIEHIAIILDGNRRWAKQRQLPSIAGHLAGSKRLKDIIIACSEAGLKALTCYSFSTENWKRDSDEVNGIFTLMADVLKREFEALNARNIRIQVKGNEAEIPQFLRAILEDIALKTLNNTGLVLQLAINYGGQAEITETAKTLVDKALQEGLAPHHYLTQEAFNTLLNGDALGTLPPPDLLIRPGGEQRLSNFLLWQCAYSELYFCDTLWPAFSVQQLLKACQVFVQRQRRFGH
jgi:undecaprenyl diphosphate synthase